MSNNMSFVDKMKEQIHKRCGKPREKAAKTTRRSFRCTNTQLNTRQLFLRSSATGYYKRLPAQRPSWGRTFLPVFFLNEGQTKQRSKKSLWSDREKRRCSGILLEFGSNSVSSSYPHASTLSSTPPTFIPVVGADGEDGESNIGVLVHVHLIRRLCECRLVIVHVADKNADIRRVWSNTNTKDKEWNTHREKADIRNTNIFFCPYSNNLITFPQLGHAQRNIKPSFFPPICGASSQFQPVLSLKQAGSFSPSASNCRLKRKTKHPGVISEGLLVEKATIFSSFDIGIKTSTTCYTHI